MTVERGGDHVPLVDHPVMDRLDGDGAPHEVKQPAGRRPDHRGDAVGLQQGEPPRQHEQERHDHRHDQAEL